MIRALKLLPQVVLPSGDQNGVSVYALSRALTTREWKIGEWKTWHRDAGLKNAARYCRRGKRGSKNHRNVEHLSVRGNQSRTNNVLKSVQHCKVNKVSALQHRIEIIHPTFCALFDHIQHDVSDQLNDMARIRYGLSIRRPKKAANMSAGEDKIFKSYI